MLPLGMQPLGMLLIGIWYRAHGVVLVLTFQCHHHQYREQFLLTLYQRSANSTAKQPAKKVNSARTCTSVNILLVVIANLVKSVRENMISPVHIIEEF